jgi:hypothetical protein
MIDCANGTWSAITTVTSSFMYTSSKVLQILASAAGGRLWE